MFYKYSGGALESETPEAYLNYLVREEKYQFFKNINHQENPNPPVPESKLKGTSQKDTFGIKMSESFTYKDDEWFSQSYDKRYVLYGDKENQYAKTEGAEGFYEILYNTGGKAAGEYKAYVMSSAGQAEQKKQEKSEAFGDSVFCKGNQKADE